MKAFTALAEPTRFQIIEMLARGELSSGEISAHFHASSSAVSQHLKILRHARLVRVRAEAQHRIYALNPVGLAEVDEWLVRIRKFWTDRLPGAEKSSGRGAADEVAVPYLPAHDILLIPPSGPV